MGCYLRLCVGISSVCSTHMCYDRRVELFPEVPSQLRNSPLGVFGELLRGRPVLNRIHGFARAVFEVPQQSLNFLFEYPYLVLLFAFAVRCQPGPLPSQLFLLSTQTQAFGFGLAYFKV